VKWPKHVDFSRPENERLNGTVNFYLNSEDSNVQIGVCHILPRSLVPESVGKEVNWYREQLKTPGIFFLYKLWLLNLIIHFWSV